MDAPVYPRFEITCWPFLIERCVTRRPPKFARDDCIFRTIVANNQKACARLNQTVKSATIDRHRCLKMDDPANSVSFLLGGRNRRHG